MGKLITTTKPLIFQSKLLCFSLLYLFTTLFLALYTILSQSKCLFRSSPLDPIQDPLFSYPSSYGEHKYAVSTTRSTCTSPIFFSDYLDVVKEIKNLIQDSSSAEESSALRYMQGNAESFGGNLSTKARFSYFDRQIDHTQVPCGFLKKFPISDSVCLDFMIPVINHVNYDAL
ncbi:hypothetical protein Ahy_A10g051332 isoform A [Arachis hypogaea]|uniref:Uncharacterized protein n=1 Tax=Arachis hypogaea TaxID=3818 RepID=A0A445BCE2_ARAHY|nr:hypothetical protein Ahy_A10g051332 isoform A [Arachis hypogaea]